jgi:hypothetical protein
MLAVQYKQVKGGLENPQPPRAPAQAMAILLFSVISNMLAGLAELVEILSLQGNKMTSHFRWFIVVAVVVLLTFSTSRHLNSQQQSSDSIPEASKWRHVAKEQRSAEKDVVGPLIRAERDKYFDQLIGSSSPLDQPGGYKGNFVVERLIAIPEIPTDSDVVAVVYFEDYQVYLSRAKRSIYTEISLQVERILKGDAAVTSGDYLTVILPGGTIKTSSQIISYGSLNDPLELQPQHRYVVFLERAHEKDSYIINKSWELRNGAAFPNSQDDKVREYHHTSLFAGMPEGEFISNVLAAVSR